MDAEGGAERDRLDELLQRAVGQQLNHDHPDRGVGPRAAQREQHREQAGAPGAHVRDVGGDEGDDRDRPDQRDAQDQARRSPTTTALNAATIVTPRK